MSSRRRQDENSDGEEEIIIGNRFILDKKLGNGAFGDVYTGIDRRTGSEVAIKLEPKKNCKMLQHEHYVYKTLRGSRINIPEFLWYGEQGEFRVLVIELMGPSLAKLFSQCNHKFTLKTTLMIGIQMVRLLEQLHRMDFIHRDLKPENFLLGTSKDPDTGVSIDEVFIIDFGLSKKYKNKARQHSTMIPAGGRKSLVGTPRYASRNSHAGYEQSRRDDLESMMYILIYFLKGKLPWQSFRGKNRKEKFRRIYQCKADTTEEELCSGLPEAFIGILKYVKNLAHEERPRYDDIVNTFINIMEDNSFEFDYRYDWINQ